MKTKDKILAQAISTYNKKGVANVTSRELAKELGISHGNLEYHYPNKEAILLAIYAQMREEISSSYIVKEEQEPFEAFNVLLSHLEVFYEKYSFFNLDFLEIGRNFQKVGALLQETYALRQKQLASFFEQFKEMGYIKDEIDADNYALLRHSVTVLIMFWKVQQVVLPKEEVVGEKRLSESVWALLSPALTPKGEEVYSTLNMLSHE